MKLIPKFEPGDVLLYNDGGIVDRLISFRTWSDVAHIEVYLGCGKSGASRNGIGAGIYPVRYSGLKYIFRPTVFFDRSAAQNFAEKMSGVKYGWFDLLSFYGFKIERCKGIICSTYGDLLLRAAGVVAFSTIYNAGQICPRDFKITPMLKMICSYEKTKV